MFFLTMEAWLFKKGEWMSPPPRHCRQVISRFDLRCSPPRPFAPPAAFVRVAAERRSPRPGRTLRDDEPEVSQPLTRPGLPFFPTALTAPLLQFLSFVSAVLFASFGRAETSAGLFGKNKGGVVVKGFTRAVQVTPTWMPSSHALTRTFGCFLWTKQLVFVVKRLIRKKTPRCCRS